MSNIIKDQISRILEPKEKIDIVESNVISDEVYQKIAKETLNSISDILSKSLGYYGSTTILEDNLYGSKISKDGFTILDKIRFNNTISTTFLNNIKTISRSLVQEVGDGSTSSVVVSNELYNQLEPMVNDRSQFLGKLPKKEIINSLNNVGELIEKKLKEKSIPINEDNFEILRNIATVSNNNDEKDGNIIYNIYKQIGKRGFIYLDKSTSEEDTFEIVNGIETSRGYVDPIFANKPNKIEAMFKEPYVFITDSCLDKTDIDFFAHLIGQVCGNGKSLVIVAKEYRTEFIDFMKIQKINNTRVSLEIAATDFPARTRKEEFEDLAIYLGTQINTKKGKEGFEDLFILSKTNNAQFYGEHIGRCETVTMTGGSTQFIKGEYHQEELDARIELIDLNIQDLKNLDVYQKGVDSEIFKLENRKARLLSKVATLFIGGKSELERDTRKYLLEDSIFACRSALDYGYIPGGNISIPKVIKDIIDNEESLTEVDKVLLQLVYSAFKETYAIVLKNSQLFSDEEVYETVESCINNKMIYDLKEKKYVPDSETKIINSVMTDIQIMRASFSVIGLLVTSNQYIRISL
ncbi:60 kDa chaperonin [Listeria phage LPJP1]|nr:60 kDa chaperonin [Listeria phage LPJP1]